MVRGQHRWPSVGIDHRQQQTLGIADMVMEPWNLDLQIIPAAIDQSGSILYAARVHVLLANG